MNMKNLRFSNFPLGKKKAMSPLLSTIILIGFAVALGGVVMSWGRAAYTAEKQVIGCQQTSLSLISYGENKGICSQDGRLYFTIQNNGGTDLEGIRVSVLGTNDIYSGVIDRKIDVADIVKLDIGYGDVGKIEKIIFVPKFNDLEEGQLCPKNGFSTENVGEC